MVDNRRNHIVKFHEIHEGNHAVSNILIIAFAIAGLILTIFYDFYRGDQELFKLAFIIVIAMCTAELLFSIIVKLAAICCEEITNNVCLRRCFIVVVQIVYLITCSIGFALTIIALIDGDKLEHSESYGCANGYGCANIMGICGKSMISLFEIANQQSMFVFFYYQFVSSMPVDCFPLA